MRIMLSWSQPASQRCAEALRDWLPDVIQQLDPWMSSEDIAKGQRWSAEIARLLDDTNDGIVCVTRANMNEPWINFEAGALAKTPSISYVRPVLLDVAPHEVTGPLAQFQATTLRDKKDMAALVDSLNAACPEPLDATRVRRQFDRTWPDFAQQIELINSGAANEAQPTPERPLSSMVAEILDRVRTLERLWSESAGPATLSGASSPILDAPLTPAIMFHHGHASTRTRGVEFVRSAEGYPYIVGLTRDRNVTLKALRPGMPVIHSTYGKGVVTTIETREGNTSATVDFIDSGARQVNPFELTFDESVQGFG